MSTLYDHAYDEVVMRARLIERAKTHPEEAQYRDSSGCTALHVLALYNPPMDAVAAVYGAFPDALTIVDDDGLMPLDVAMQHNASKAVIKYLSNPNRRRSMSETEEQPESDSEDSKDETYDSDGEWDDESKEDGMIDVDAKLTMLEMSADTQGDMLLTKSEENEEEDDISSASSARKGLSTTEDVSSSNIKKENKTLKKDIRLLTKEKNSLLEQVLSSSYNCTSLQREKDILEERLRESQKERLRASSKVNELRSDVEKLKRKMKIGLDSENGDRSEQGRKHRR
eukprot:CAMPEP_0171301130 /NCGR_PEP_ID=MMETSP0816-20121228/10214_1 /TAXON_ID=420281 /ORGANISM="Proboscia inermis, Strain CCAP1064/1" /LENGTH=283 /DNA_ID=CAMNT_0011778395 /DNA_START=60 /DNA_END=911 /DNA_ORIENTATION=+